MASLLKKNGIWQLPAYLSKGYAWDPEEGFTEYKGL
jgi:hypothetical protein